MKKKDIVQKKKDFNDIIKQNSFLSSSYFTLYKRKNETNKPKFGIAVSKKNGNAVLRNKLKRQYRNIITENYFNFPKEYDYIIMVKKASIDAVYKEMSESMKNTLESEEK